MPPSLPLCFGMCNRVCISRCPPPILPFPLPATTILRSRLIQKWSQPLSWSPIGFPILRHINTPLDSSPNTLRTSLPLTIPQTAYTQDGPLTSTSKYELDSLFVYNFRLGHPLPPLHVPIHSPSRRPRAIHILHLSLHLSDLLFAPRSSSGSLVCCHL